MRSTVTSCSTGLPVQWSMNAGAGILSSSGRGDEISLEKGGLPHAPFGEERAGADEPQVEFSQVLLGEERAGKVPDVLGAIHEVSLNIRARYNYTGSG